MLEKLVGNGKLTSQKFENIGNSNDSLKGKFEFETSEFMDANAERIYLNPMLSFGKTENLLKKTERQFPVEVWQAQPKPSVSVEQAAYELQLPSSETAHF